MSVKGPASKKTPCSTVAMANVVPMPSATTSASDTRVWTRFDDGGYRMAPNQTGRLTSGRDDLD